MAQERDANAIEIPSHLVQMLAGSRAARVAAGEEGSFPDFDQVTRGMKSDKGLFTLWYYPPDAKDKDQEKLLAQIPAGLLGEQIMLSTSYSGGGFFTGFPLDEHVVRWELLDRQLLLIEPETRFVADQAKEVSDVVQRTYPGRIRAAVPLVTRSPQGDPLIDLGPLLKSDFADIGWTSGGFASMGLARHVQINPQLSRWRTRKTFELNTEIQVELAVARPSPPGSYDRRMVHFSFWRLPRSDYQPRVADDRVGYFLTTNRDWSKPVTEREIFNRYINRWHLVKRDPSLEVSEPRQPIVFYIEKTVPVRWRRAVRDGILEWNKAFERIGFANAIEVRQQTDDNEWKDLDPEDMRYSFIRWIVTGAGFAMGPSRANPFTGQIYDADIIFDDSMVRFFEQEATVFLPQSLVELKWEDPALRGFLERFPQWQRPARPWERRTIGASEESVLWRAARRRLEERGHVCCDYARGMRWQMQLASALLADQPRAVKERLLYDVIKEVVMHEVGHTLGLRHNFAASAVYTLDELKQRRAAGQVLSGSVMDYNPIFLHAGMSMEGHFITPTIGPYDYWAIEYGYRPFDAAASGGTKEAAKQDQAAGKKEEKSEQPAPAENEEDEEEDEAEESEQTDGDIELPDISQLPPEIRRRLPEILAQLPPEARRMLESRVAGAAVRSGGPPSKPQGSGAGDTPFRAAPAGESEMLLAIARRSTEPELLYATDEDTTILSPDPRTNPFDMGADPLDWARSRIALVDERMSKILEWAVREQESWRFALPAFLNLVMERAFVLDYVGRYIGGQYFSRAHRGDPNAPPPFVPVEAARQRAALKFIEEHLFSENAFRFPPEVLNHLAPSRWWHEGSNVSFTLDFPVHELIGLLQWWNLFDRFFPNTLRRIHDAELKAAGERLTAAEYIRTLRHACWSEVSPERAAGGPWSDEKPLISGIRRSLQREYLGIVEPLVRTPPGVLLSPDLHAMLEHSLRELSGQIEGVLAGQKFDFASTAHLKACKSRIDRMLAAELREFERGGGMGLMMMEELAGPAAGP
jgi:hypothetical protein